MLLLEDFLAMSRKAQRVFVSKKNSGLEINLEFFYNSHTEVETVDKIRIEEWLKKESLQFLTRFRMTFPQV